MKQLKFTLIGVAVILLIVAYFYLFGNFSTGFRAGTIVKLSKKGVIFKTYEGELNMGMVVTDNAAASANTNIWPFSVENDEALIKQMEDAMLNGHRVRLNYKEKYIKFPWVGDTKYVVYGIQVNP